MNRAVLLILLSGLFLLASCKPAVVPAPSAPLAAKTPAAAETAPAAKPEAVKPEIPTLVVQTFDGGTFDLSKHRGNWVVVNFWATWCNPCLKEIPELDAFDKARGNVDVIGLAYEEIEKPDMQAFLKEHVFSYPIAVVDVYKPPEDFDIPKGLPMTYLIAPDGKIAKQFLGPISVDELARIIDKSPARPASAS
jgi:thiol-disulfide isomerase/thioredoxin